MTGSRSNRCRAKPCPEPILQDRPWRWCPPRRNGRVPPPRAMFQACCPPPGSGSERESYRPSRVESQPGSLRTLSASTSPLPGHHRDMAENTTDTQRGSVQSCKVPSITVAAGKPAIARHSNVGPPSHHLLCVVRGVSRRSHRYGRFGEKKVERTVRASDPDISEGAASARQTPGRRATGQAQSACPCEASGPLRGPCPSGSTPSRPHLRVPALGNHDAPADVSRSVLAGSDHRGSRPSPGWQPQAIRGDELKLAGLSHRIGATTPNSV